jgi:hypothetical protein
VFTHFDFKTSIFNLIDLRSEFELILNSRPPLDSINECEYTLCCSNKNI